MLPRSKLTKRLAAAAKVRQCRRLSSSTAETGEIKPKQAKTADHEIREKARRIKKAERDERMDITMSMTPVKEYMGGFTRPRDLRISNWFPGGAYLAKRKKYEPPPPEAYTSHTVFLLETRYPVRHELGRKDAIEHFVGVCRTGDFPAVLRKMNSLNSPSEARLAMDNAIWPWVHPKAIKRQVWLEKGETLQETLARLEKEDEAAVQAMVEWEEKRERERPMEEEEEERQAQEATSSRYQRNGLRHPDAQRFFKRQGQGRQPGSHELVATELLHPEGSDGQMSQRRMFHFSLRAAADEPGFVVVASAKAVAGLG
ncbi:uncharacterized protein LAESUDRAFT_763896 [Laetiporus sulphureus 93-53]|uniref:Uncharacterized protein n=1 Tax=Laetiporus sulphureus 93-53 TaxID=1314785 RepID=A0A165BM89_9APHY|nr:uncharacterized protein LAESUDRAFT_763896 [Laetiporus sulphureus 93-53]KZT01303.1 hypothetical protein LAESUDRAFT_763896 [Laetiporus sulphureus 93-53]